MSRLRRHASGAVLITLGTLVGQGLVFLSTPLVARLYGPETLGEATIFLAVASVLTPVLSLRLELLIPTAPDEEVRWIARRAMQVIGIGATVATVGYGLVTQPPSLMVLPMFWLTAAGLAGIAVSMQLLIRDRVYGRIGAGKAATGAATAGTQVGLGGAPDAVRGLEVGFAAGYVVGWVVQNARVKRQFAWIAPAVERQRRLMLDGLRLASAGLLNVLSLWFILFSLGLLFPPAEAGLFAAVQRLLVTPVGLLTASVLPVVTGSVAEAVREGRSATAMVRRWLTILVPAGCAVAVIVALVPESLFLLILGDEFAGVGAYAQAMAVMIGAQIAAGPLGQILVALRQVGAQLVWDASRLIALTVAGVTCAVLQVSATALVFVLCLVFAVSYAAFLATAVIVALRLDGRAQALESE
ncbi:MAG: hypothetical protein Q4G34_04505 [Micrococcus sp.]|nr:hypothetical protein [Micrococcus sp.]